MTFNGTTYSIPAQGETGWSGLSAFLIDVGNNAQSTTNQRGTIRVATTSPVTVSSTDYAVLSNLTVAGAVAFTLPAGVDKTIYVIGDTKGDAQTNNVTITPASGNINGASTYVIKNNYGIVAIQYSSAATEWKVVGRYFTKIDAANEVFGILGAANGGTGIANNSAATLTRSGSHALTLTTTGTTGLTLPTTGTVAVTADKLSVFAATTSAELASVISNETGTGLLVFNDTPTLVAPVLGAATGTSLLLSGLTASRAMVTDVSKNLTSSAVTATELGYLSGVTSPTGTGALVLASSPTLVTPVLGVASATSINKVTLTAPLTGSTLTVADGKTLTVSNTLTLTGTDASSVAFGAGGTVTYTSNNLSVFAATTSAQLAGVISDETGSGALVFASTPTLVTPVLGVATATTINKVALTAPATSATLTIADGKTLTASNTLTLTGTDASSVAFGAGGTVAYTSNNLSVFAATTSAQLAGILSDETGSGLAVFGTSPTFLTSISLGAAAELRLNNAGNTFYTGFKSGNAAANKIWTLPLVDGASGTALKTDGAGTLSFGAVAGGGSINYITDSDFEGAATTGYAVYADAAGTTPVDGTGGVANVTVNARAASAFVGTYTASGVNPLRGSYSMEFAKGAVNYQGQGVGYAFTIAYADISKPLRIDFECDAGTTYTASDMGVYVYDVTNATLITPSSVNIPAGASKFSCTFNATTSVSYRLIFHVQTTNATAYYLKFDSIAIGPNVLVQGAAVSYLGELAFAPNSGAFGTVANSKFFCWRVGSKMIVEGSFTGGTPAGGVSYIDLPSGLNVDTTALSTTNDSYLGYCSRSLTGAAASPFTGNNMVVFYDLSAANSGRVNLSTAVNGSQDGTYTAIVGTSTFSASDRMIFRFEIPIGQWTSNTTLATSRVEFASNSSTSTTATDTTSFAYGPAGNQIQNITGDLDRSVQFQNAIQPTDSLMIEIKDVGTGLWMPLATTLMSVGTSGSGIIAPLIRVNTIHYGVGFITPTSSTVVVVRFGAYPSTTGATTYAGAGTAWSGGAGGCYWRVRKSSGIGAGEVAPATATSSGYVVSLPTSQVTAVTGNGFGSSGTRIKRFTTATTVGTGVTYADSATNGGSFTIVEPGVYGITYTDSSGTRDVIGISKNAGNLAGDIRNETAGSGRLAFTELAIAGSGTGSISVPGIRLVAGDVIRAHTADGVVSGTTYSTFIITQLFRTA